MTAHKVIPASNKTQIPMRMTTREIIQPAPAKPALEFQQALALLRKGALDPARDPSLRELVDIVAPRVSDYVCKLVSAEGQLDYAQKLLRIRTLQRDELRAELATLKGERFDTPAKPIDVTARLAAALGGRERGWAPGVKLGAG